MIKDNSSSNQDANNYTTAGIYMSSKWQNNAPTNYGIMIVLSTGGAYKAQLFFDVVYNAMYHRTFTNNAWSNWTT